MVMFIEVHELESLELLRDFHDLLCFARLDDFHAFRVPLR